MLNNINIFCLLLLTSFVCPGHTQQTRTLKTASSPIAPSLSWTVEAWTGDSTPYHKIRYQLFKSLATPNASTAAAAGYKAQVQKSPHDPRLVFEYVYSTYRAAQLSSAFGDGGELVEAEQSLDLVLPTHTYEFARLHFLIAAKNHPSHALKVLGERLLKHNPDDVLVEWQMGSILQPSMVPAERQKALNYANDLIHRSPGNPDYYANLAGTYYDIWLGTKNHPMGKRLRRHIEST